jgi:hypothetical protein
MTMKRVLSLLSILMLVAVGCSKPETKLPGKWESPTTKGFMAEFRNDHTGTTFSPDPNQPKGKPAEIPFKWTLESDGRVKITEGKTTYFGKLNGKKLELDLGGATAVLQKAK